MYGQVERRKRTRFGRVIEWVALFALGLIVLACFATEAVRFYLLMIAG